MKKVSLVLTVLVVLSVLAPSVGYSSSDTPSFNLRVSATSPVGHHTQTTEKEWANAITKQSNGQITFDLYLSGELYTSNDTPRVLPTGLIDVVNESGDAFGTMAPAMNVIMLPGLWDNIEHQSRGLHAMMDKLDADLQSKNIKLLGFTYAGDLIGPLTKKPVHSVNDLKGLKIRAPGGDPQRLIANWGAAPTSMSTSEVYTALQRGTIDGAITNMSSLYGRSWYEVAKNLLNVSIYISAWPWAMNLDKWKKLPKNLQDIMLKVSDDMDKTAIERAVQGDKASLQKLLDKGVILYTPTTAELAGYSVGKKEVTEAWAAKDPKFADLVRIAEQTKQR